MEQVLSNERMLPPVPDEPNEHMTEDSVYTEEENNAQSQTDEYSFAGTSLPDDWTATDTRIVENARLWRGKKNKDEEPPSKFDMERRKVMCLKSIVVFLLVSAAVVVSFLTYHFTTQEQKENFELQFYDFAVKVAEEFHQDMDTKVWTADTQSSLFTSKFDASTWPLVTMPDYQQQTTGAVQIADADYVTFSPLVSRENRSLWEVYASLKAKSEEYDSVPKELYNGPRTIADGIYRLDGNRTVNDDGSTPGPYSPIWQVAPVDFNAKAVMFNDRSEPVRRQAIDNMIKFKIPCLTDFIFNKQDNHPRDFSHNQPRSILFYPIFSDFKWRNVVGSISIDFPWDKHFSDALPENVRGVTVVMKSSLGRAFTYVINGENGVTEYDNHDSNYDHMVYTRKYGPKDLIAASEGAQSSGSVRRSLQQTADQMTSYTMNIYPSAEFESQYISNKPAVYTAVVVLIFVFTSALFILYDCIVEHRQNMIMDAAQRSNAIVSSLFPATVRERLFDTAEPRRESAATSVGTKNLRKLLPRRVSGFVDPPTIQLKKFLNPELANGFNPAENMESEPIADMFPDTTIMFADIVGFTAWSSEREPHQVFQLLETLYSTFDSEAKKLGVFKIETIGDCYVAVCGLPDPNKDHAELMARFAFRLLFHMKELTVELEQSLGPGTCDLGMRFGLHSGPVTAGVLRGEKSRFQLFGDAMNTAARMESTGEKNMIQCSEETARHLREADKGHWLTPREGLVKAKGKGEVKTFWVAKNSFSNARRSSDGSRPLPRQMSWRDLSVDSELQTVDSDVQPSTNHGSSWEERLIKWNVAVLEDLLVPIIVQRGGFRRSIHSWLHRGANTPGPERDYESIVYLDELADKVKFPSFDPRIVRSNLAQDTSARGYLIPEKARAELYLYVTQIASLYRKVHFHNFEHASHVTMSANKLIKRMYSGNADKVVMDSSMDALKSRAANLHASTFGISGDPLAQFAVVFAALVHDVDHTGVPNVQLVEENDDLALRYQNTSVAEQNSIDVALTLLMEPNFDELRACMFWTEVDMKRFRQLLINTVMSTDIADKQRLKSGKTRWERGFQKAAPASGTEEQNSQKSDMVSVRSRSSIKSLRSQKSDRSVGRDTYDDLKATVVVECILQASDVAHTMQHWATFLKWNKRLYKELYCAYRDGRAKRDPSVNWYPDQISFFDNYVIPLAKKLQECGVFGAAGDEYVAYAVENRRRWEEEGEEVTEIMIKECAEKLEKRAAVEYAEHESAIPFR